MTSIPTANSRCRRYLVPDVVDIWFFIWTHSRKKRVPVQGRCLKNKGKRLYSPGISADDSKLPRKTRYRYAFKAFLLLQVRRSSRKSSLLQQKHQLISQVLLSITPTHISRIASLAYVSGTCFIESWHLTAGGLHNRTSRRNTHMKCI